jgi:6-pyruvoyl-tetrahydropterin synthase
MHNKGSCRVCRSYFILTSGCTACTENVSWKYNKCDKTEGVTHSHNYYRIAYIKEEGNSSSTMVINSNEIEVLANL